MTDSESDRSLDERLRDVPLPAGLLQKLRRVGEQDELVLDRRLAAVPLPTGMVTRLREAINDEILGEKLRDVPLPWGLLARLRMIPRIRTRSRIGQLAVAASLTLIVAAGYLSALAGLVAGLRPVAVADQVLYVDPGPLNLVSEAIEPPSFVWQPAPSLPADVAQSDATRQLDVALDSLEPARTGPADELFVAFGGHDDGSHLWQEIVQLTWGPLGAPASVRRDLPELDPAPSVSALGLQPPLVPGGDCAFVYLHGTHPPVFPAVHADLRTSEVPLATRTTSFERTQRLLAERRLPRDGEVRVEDFLAAMPYGFPRPNGGLGLRTAAGPSVFGDPQAGLLQIGVQAADVDRRRASATHLTLVVDASESMRWGGRLERTQQALRELVERLGPHDRLSLVVFNEEITQLVENAGREHEAELNQVIEALQARGGTNLGLALEQAISLALDPLFSDGRQSQLALLTDGRAHVPQRAQGVIAQLLEQAARRGLGLRVVVLSEHGDAEHQVQALVAAAGGELIHASEMDDLRWALLEALTGGSSVVAQDARLRVEFNPQVVAAYRLVGHEPTPLASLEPVEWSAEMRSGQAATALLEVWLRPGQEDLVGWATLDWRDAAQGRMQQRRQRLSRLQFAPSFGEAQLSLQSAAIAAETAQVLRGSLAFRLTSPATFSYQPKPDGLQHVLDVARRVNPRLARRSGFQRFVSFVEDLDRERRSRGN